MEEQTNSMGEKLHFLSKELKSIKNGQEILDIRRSQIENNIREIQEAIIIQSPETLLQIQKLDVEEQDGLNETIEDMGEL